MGLGLLLGDITSTQEGATSAYKHVIVPETSTTDMLSTTMWEETPAHGQKKFAGIHCHEFMIEAARGQFCNLELGLRGDGSEASGSALSGVSLVSDEAYLKYSNVTVTIGGSWDGTDHTGGTSYNAKLRDVRVSMRNNAQLIHGFTYSTVSVTGVLFKEFREWLHTAVTVHH